MLGRYIDLGNPVAWDHPLNQSLVAWWLPLPNNQGGSRLFDLAGANTGALTNGPTWAAGPNGFGAVQFDGTDDYIGTGAATGEASGGYTYSALVRTGFASSSNSRRGVIDWRAGAIGAGDQNRVRLIWVSASLGFYLDDKSRYAYSALPAFGDAEWHHLTVSKPAAVGCQFYWDGRPLTTTAQSLDTGTIQPTSGLPIYLGLDAENAGWVWSGRVADVRIHSRALSASDVWGLYDQSLRGHPDTLRRWSRRVYAFAPPAGGSGVTGTGAATLGTLTGSGSGTVAVAGTGAAALGALAGSGTGSLPVGGTGAAVLGALRGAGTGAVALTASGAATLGPLTGSAAGSAAVTGSASATLGALTGAATSTAAVVGTGAVALAPLTGNSAGAVLVAGAGAASLGTLTGVAAGSGTPLVGAATLGALTGSGTGTVAVAGTGAAALGRLGGPAAGAVTLTAVGSVVLGPAVGAGAGTAGGVAPVPVPAGFWALDCGGHTWALTCGGRHWALDCGGHTWAFVESATMPATADPVRMTVGDVRLLTGDFGSLKELQAADLTGGSVAVAPAGVTAAGVQRGLYWVSAWFTAAAAGEYVVTFTGELADGTILKRKAALVVE